MEWNISGLKSEVDKWLYLNHIETEWPHVQRLVLLTGTESHLRSHDIPHIIRTLSVKILSFPYTVLKIWYKNRFVLRVTE